MDLLTRKLITAARYCDATGQYERADKIQALLSHGKYQELSTREAMKKEILSEKEHDGYVVRKEKVSMFCDDDSVVEIESAYTPSGDYIGSPEDAKYIVEKRGIKPEISKKDHSVCSIGFCDKDQKWYGWSHRAMNGFGVGDTAEECFPTGNKKGGKIKTLAEAKKAAQDFAESVS